MRTPILLLFLFVGSAFALTPAERTIVEQARNRIAELTANLEQRDATISNLTGTLAAQAAESIAQSDDIRQQAARLDALVVERDSLKQETLTQAQEISVLQADLNKAGDHIRDLTKKVDDAKAEAHRNAKERDVFVYGFAILAAVATVIGLFPAVNKVLNVAFPWTLAWIPAGVALMFAYYGIIRFVLWRFIQSL